MGGSFASLRMTVEEKEWMTVEEKEWMIVGEKERVGNSVGRLG